MNQVLERILQSGCVDHPDKGAIAVHSQITRDEGEFLKEIILKVRPKVSLEVGLAYGVSSLFICEALMQVHAERHIIIDPHQFGVQSSQFVTDNPQSLLGWEGIGLRNLNEAGYGRLIEFHEKMSYLALPQLVAEGRNIDFAFIDGWHTFDYGIIDFFYTDLLLRPGGVIVLDDVDRNHPGLIKVCRYIVTNRKYTVFPAPENGPTPKSSLRRRVAFNTPMLSRFIRRIAKPEVLEPNSELGLPYRRYIALRKESDDMLGDGSRGSRRWDFHRDF
jgi:predicted O-methyltransferase YrrM